MKIPRALSPYFEVYRSPRMAIMVVMGFASGLPFALPRGTLQVWMATVGIDLRTIGIFSLIGLPYTLKFLWSPFMDRFVPPFLGRRRGWIVLVQLALFLGVVGISFSSPEKMVIALAGIALFVAFGSASQDIVIDAYRTDLLKQHERGFGTAIFVIGYRIGMLVSGGLALVLSDRIGWKNTYLVMAAFMAVVIVGTIFSPEPKTQVAAPKTMREAVWGPLKDFFSRKSAPLFFLAIILYKIGDSYAGSLSQVFLIKTGFSATDVGAIYKGVGFICTIVGVTLGGTLMVRLGLLRSLLSFGVFQMISNFSFMLVAWLGKNYGAMVFAVAFENFSGGLGDAAFIAFLMSLCNQKFTATQYALLSSLAAIGRTFVGPTSGFVVEWIGWSNFFLFTGLVSLPGLLILLYLRHDISPMNASE
jgi:MFS transporter, PAT family, beta-lactamase induction signal transducer AmpG